MSANGQWQPIETAPVDEPILVFGYWKPTFRDPEPRMAVWERDSRNSGRGVEFYCEDINGDITHWQPLPAPPV